MFAILALSNVERLYIPPTTTIFNMQGYKRMSIKKLRLNPHPVCPSILIHIRRYLLLCFLLCGYAAYAEDRPKIGLVLGGGGAAGVAHVGVLKVLEEHNIPIDVITGTSMGAIIAGLYASGMTVDELEETVYSLDWLSLFNDEPSRKQQSFHQKRQSTGFFNLGSLGIQDGKLLPPSGFVSGQKLLFELRRLFRPVAHIDDFDQLTIPFRAVATDIESGKQVVLGKGNIAQAIRASMSIPGIFSPVQIEDKLLVDGFVANNVPVDVAREMGADILIVVRIPTFLEEQDNLKSAIDISLQAMQLMMLKSSAPQLKTLSANDILIEPGIKDLGSLSFDRVAETIPIGIKAANKHSSALERLSETLNISEQKHRQPLKSKLLEAPIHQIIINNESVLNDNILLQRLAMKTGSPLDTHQLQQGLDAIYGLGYFSLVDYTLAADQKGGAVLTVNAYKRSTGNSHLYFGASLADNLEGDTSYQLGIKHELSGLNDQGAEWNNSLIFGDSFQLESQFYQPVPIYNAFLEATAGYQEQDFFFFEGEERISESRGNEFNLSVDIGKEFGTWGEARLGTYYSHLEPNEKTGSNNIGTTVLKSAGFTAEFNVDTTDNDLLPTSGNRLNTSYTHGSKALGSDQEFDKLEIRFSKAWKKDKHHLILGGELGTIFDDDAISPADQLFLGGLGRMSGLVEGQLRGNHLLLGSAVYLHELSNISTIDGALYAGASIEAGNVWQQKDNVKANNLLTSGSAFVGAETPVGLAILGMAKTEGYNFQPFFYLGQNF